MDGEAWRCIDSSDGNSGLGESECDYPCFSGASNWLGSNNEYRRVTSIGHVSRWLRADRGATFNAFIAPTPLARLRERGEL